MTEETDDQLITRVLRSKSERAFTVLYDRHTPYLWRLALRLTAGDQSRAQEAVAEAWVRASARLHTFQGRSRCSTWLAGFLVNVHREIVRASNRFEPLEEWTGDAVAPETDPLARVDIDRVLARLPEGFREVLVLHDVDGYTHEEIAQMLGIVPGTSKSQLSRARRRVREMLQDPLPR